MEIYLSDFLSLAVAHFIALLSPGADFFLILANSSKYGKKAGIITSFGIASANLVYILLALFGISLIKNNELIFTFIKILGSIYLLYIGYLLANSKKRDLFSKYTDKNKQNAKKSFIYFNMGFLSAILNPKNSIFYFTMFSISVENYTSNFIQFFYAIWMFLAVLLWDIFIVYLIVNKKSQVFLQKYSFYIEKISGYVLISIGTILLINL